MTKATDPTTYLGESSPGESILTQALQLTQGQRAKDYGPVEESLARIAAFWNATLGNKLSAPIEPEEVGLMMIGLKMSRYVGGEGTRDSLRDIAGYADCVDRVRVDSLDPTFIVR